MSGHLDDTLPHHRSFGSALSESISAAKRSWIMSRVGAKNTPAEMRVRRIAHSLGLRFRLHRADLPGKPDIVFPRHRIAVFVHGCFWHRHHGCKRARMPQTNQAYWRQKFRRNTERDRRVIAELASIGWRALVIWECETPNSAAITETLRRQIVPPTTSRRSRQTASATSASRDSGTGSRFCASSKARNGRRSSSKVSTKRILGPVK